MALRRKVMAWEHQKSTFTVFLDFLRFLLVLGATGFFVLLIWKWSWIVAIITVIPIFLIIFFFTNVLFFFFYALTPEERLKAKAFKAMEKGDFKKGFEWGDKFVKKFKVNVPKE